MSEWDAWATKVARPEPKKELPWVPSDGFDWHLHNGELPPEYRGRVMVLLRVHQRKRQGLGVHGYVTGWKWVWGEVETPVDVVAWRPA